MQQITIPPVNHPLRGTIRPPGSKSITNRALILAALANGPSTLTGVLDSQDTRVMVESLRRLGFNIQQNIADCHCSVEGLAGHIPAHSAELWLENSGTSIRFLTALCTLGHGTYRLDGVERMRQRPIADLVDTLQQLGADISCDRPGSGCPPLTIHGTQHSLRGGAASIQGSISSQFLSALLMTAPACPTPVQLTVVGELVSKPYVQMTLQMMRHFGADFHAPNDLSQFIVNPIPLQPRQYDIEPDASAASYFFAAAAVTAGTVTVTGLHKHALQGDVAFVDALQQMGCHVEWKHDRITVKGQPLHGIDIDMNAISDTAQTLAAVAVFASSPTRIRNVAHMR
ncbi:MAG: 3-phosphoshikimate 1-carboxyvinyltransferase, partial [Planctomycetota bacterium]